MKRPSFKHRDTEVDFLPAAVELLERPPSPLGRGIAITIILLVVIAIAWSIIGKVDIMAIGRGRIINSGESKTVEAAADGTVQEVLVANGDRVQPGSPLIRIEPEMALADREALLARAAEQLLMLARMSAFLGETLDTGAATEIPGRDRIIARAAMLAEMDRLERDEKILSMKRDLEGLRARLDAATASRDAISRQLPLKMEQLSAKKQLLDKGLTPRLQYLDMEQQLIGMKGDLQAIEANIAETGSGIAAKTHELAQIQASYELRAREDLERARTELATLAEDLRKADIMLDRHEIRSPVAGTIQQLSVHTIGAVVQAGQPLLVVVPDDAQLEIKADIENMDIGFVRPGQLATIKVDAFPFTRHGTIPGTVVYVSGDAIAREQAGGQKLIYEVTIKPDKNFLTIEGRAALIAPGMEVSAEITTGRRRIIDYVLSPVMKAMNETSKER